MPVKKPVAAKKTVAKKSAPAKSASSTKPAETDPVKSLAENVANAIKTGQFDGFLSLLDDALIDRMNVESRKTAAPVKKSPVADAPKKVSPPPKRVAKVKPEVGVAYMIATKFKPLAGAKVEFVRFKTDDDTKAVVKMLTDKPGSPKGKRVAVPTSALEPVPAAATKKRAAKK